MTITSGQKSLPAIGFLTITRDVEHGLFGGYLVLNALGRPLEFHCTAPVRPSRAQEILYGRTLDPYLYGERIGPTLLEKSKSAPVAVFTDVEPAMAARQLVSTPMVLVLGGSTAAAPVGVHDVGSVVAAARADRLRYDSAHPHPAPTGLGLFPFGLGRYHVACSDGHRQDCETVRSNWSQFADQIDLDEPFGRIREAIDEARSSAR